MTLEQQQRLAWLSHDDRVLTKPQIDEWAALKKLESPEAPPEDLSEWL